MNIHLYERKVTIMEDNFDKMMEYLIKATDCYEAGDYIEGFEWLCKYNSLGLKDNPNFDMMSQDSMLLMIKMHREGS